MGYGVIRVRYIVGVLMRWVDLRQAAHATTTVEENDVRELLPVMLVPVRVRAFALRSICRSRGRRDSFADGVTKPHLLGSGCEMYGETFFAPNEEPVRAQDKDLLERVFAGKVKLQDGGAPGRHNLIGGEDYRRQKGSRAPPRHAR